MPKKNQLLKISSDPRWKMLSDVKTSSTVNHKIKSSIETQSGKMSVSSELTNYLKIKEDNGNISLYTHVQALLDLFIFQKPLRPIEYFEYYSEQLKQYYHRPWRNPDLDFLNNIELNVCNKLTYIYKDTREEQKEDTANNILDFKEEMLQYEVENEYEENIVKQTNEFGQIVIQDLSKINYLFNKVGCGITNDEAYLIGLSMNHMSNQDKFKNIRYWGKIFGLKHNYYVLECELQKKELEYKLMILNNLLKNNIKNFMDVDENVYEHEEGSMMGIYEQYEEMSKIKVSASLTTSNSTVNESSFVKSGFQDFNLCIPSFAEESDVDDYEMCGFGTNKKLYFVTNQLFDQWVELPVLKPHHIIQSRNINQYFVGDLDAPVKSYPLFRGLEKHYLRAQIARITAATQISPRDYFIIDRQHRKINWTGLSSFQAKVLSQKWNHDYVENINYQPPSVYALLNPTNWVHHTPLITEEGVTKAWAELRKSRNDYESIKEYANEETYEMTSSIDSVAEDPDPLIALSEDGYADKVPPWKFETINPFDGTATQASVKSNLWPGAFAVAWESIVDYTYCGWGQKWRANGFRTPIVLCDPFQAELPVDPATMTEAKDPTYEDEQLFYWNIQQLQEERKKKRAAITHLTVYDVNEEDEERIITFHDYD